MYIDASYFQALENEMEYKIAPFWKRFLSMIIDLATIYPLFFLFKFISHWSMKYIFIAIFLYSLFFQYGILLQE